jgi:hypothetical protein
MQGNLTALGPESRRRSASPTISVLQGGEVLEHVTVHFRDTAAALKAHIARVGGFTLQIRLESIGAPTGNRTPVSAVKGTLTGLWLSR